MADDAIAIRSYGEAAAAAMGLNERCGYGHAAAALDANGSLIDLTVFEEPHQTIYDALFYAHGLILFDPSVTRLVLLSTLHRDVAQVKERDIETLRGAQRLFGETGVEIVDWIQTDGDQIRSVGLTTENHSAWRDVN